MLPPMPRPLQSSCGAVRLRPQLPEQFLRWVWRALQGDLGSPSPPPAGGRRGVEGRQHPAPGRGGHADRLRLGQPVRLRGGYFRNSWVDRLASFMSVLGVSVPHYWLGMVMVIVFSSQLMWLPATGAGPGGSGDWAWDWEHMQFMIMPAITMSVIPMGIIARTVRALVADILTRSSSSA
jgi:peptide/nickel transport system permease protein